MTGEIETLDEVIERLHARYPEFFGDDIPHLDLVVGMGLQAFFRTAMKALVVGVVPTLPLDNKCSLTEKLMWDTCCSMINDNLRKRGLL